MEFATRGVPFAPQALLTIFYRGSALAAGYRADFICFELIIVEVKALARLTTIEEAQIINYLKASKRECALLLNFGAPRLEYKRFRLSNAPLP